VKKLFILFVLTLLGSSDFFAQVDQTLSDTLALDEIVVTASRHREKITEAPATVQVLTTRELSRFAGSNPLELVAGFRGIEFTRFGVDGITLNARGFNNAFNNKVLEIVDGRNNTAAVSGNLPIYNNGTMNKEDILRYEVVTGPQTALYGPNALNLVLNTITKDPRTYPGTTLATSIGNQGQFSSRLRHAQQVNDRWAYKILGEFAGGTEFKFYDTVYVPDRKIPFTYTDTIPEQDVDFDFSHIRGEGHVYYRVSEKADIILSGGGSSNDYLQVTNTGRNQFNDRTHAFLQLRYVHPSFYVNIYNTWGSLGENSYRIKEYSIALDTLLKKSLTYPMARDSAIEIALIKEESQRLNAEVQYNTFIENAGLRIISSMDYQLQRPNGYGQTLVDSFERISISQVGAVLQMEKALPLDMKLVGALRYDHHENFGDFFAPKFTLIKHLDDGLVRAGFAKAYAMPTILHQYAGINRQIFGNGGVGIKYIPNNSHKSLTTYTEPLKPEEVLTWELGYKGKISKPFFIDISGYYSKSNNFITPANRFEGRVLEVNGVPVTHNPSYAGQIDLTDTLRNASFFANFNYAEVNTWGIDVGMTWNLQKGIEFSLNYSWIDSDITDSGLENKNPRDTVITADEKSLNAPHHRGSASLLFTNMLKDKFHFMLGTRYVQQYDFYSGNQIGTEEGEGKKGMVKGNQPIYNFDWGPLGGFLSCDFSAGYSFTPSISANLNITNVFNSRQIEFVGSPSIGRLIMAEVRVNLK
jgi:outer membrane receptor protein involved in Fe transport